MTGQLELTQRIRVVYDRIVASGANLVPGETPGCVEGSAGAALNGALYAEPERAEPDPLQVAAYLLRYLVKNHCFTDGNKRVGWASAVDYLHASGFGLNAEQDEAAEFVERVASGAISDVGEIAIWIADRLTDISLP